MRVLLLFSRDAYCSVSSFLDMLVSVTQFAYESICIFLVIYISICFAFFMKIVSERIYDSYPFGAGLFH